MTRSADDRRRQRTRSALFSAFATLVHEGRYHDISVRDIALRAGVGRSTFYDHFRGKDELLLHSMSGLLSVLADAVVDPDNPRLAGVLAHFWQNRRLARRLLFADAVAPRIDRHLAQLLTERLGDPPPLLAAQIAAAQLGLVRAWLAGNVVGGADEVAAMLGRASTALADGLGSPTPGRGPGRGGRHVA